MNHGLWVRMDAGLAQDCERIAKLRIRDAKTRKPGNNLAVGQERSDDFARRGVFAEGAFSMLVCPPMTWIAYSPERDLSHTPEFSGRGFAIDVKCVQRLEHRLLVPRDSLKDNWCYVAVYDADRPLYWIAGWAIGSILRRFPVMPTQNRPAWGLRLDMLKEVSELFKLLGI
jgi:hypothetical protein